VIIPVILLNLVFYTIVSKQVIIILKSVTVDRSFDQQNSKSLFIISIAFIVGAFVINIAEGFAVRQVFTTFGNDNLGMNYSPNYSMLFTGILLIVLAGAFKYGNYLQDEFDETV